MANITIRAATDDEKLALQTVEAIITTAIATADDSDAIGVDADMPAGNYRLVSASRATSANGEDVLTIAVTAAP